MAKTDHLVVRKNGVVCTVCGSVEPVHVGHGTPMSTFVYALRMVAGRHPRKRHDDPFGKKAGR